MFRTDASVDDIDLEDLPPSLLHPAGQRYFFVRQRDDEVRFYYIIYIYI